MTMRTDIFRIETNKKVIISKSEELVRVTGARVEIEEVGLKTIIDISNLPVGMEELISSALFSMVTR